jgi:hypothetical protein
MPAAFRLIVAATVLVLTLGPALSRAAPAGPVCKSPCCAPVSPAPEAMGHGHDAAPTVALMADCCHPAAETPCDLSRDPVTASSVAVVKTKTVSEAPSSGVGAFQRMPIDSSPSAMHRTVNVIAAPSSFPPLFLLKNALLC